MKHLIHTYILFFAVCALSLMSSCDSEKELAPPPGDKISPRTVLVYMVAKNNLSSYSKNDLNEIRLAAQAGDLGDSRLLVYCADSDSLPRLWEIDSDVAPSGRVKLKEYDDDMLSVTSERMSQVIDDMKELAPANKYGLIMWGHGTGYLEDGIEENFPMAAQSLIAPQSYGGESSSGRSYWMNTTTLARVLDGAGFDWIYFDCCFMAGVEVAYELRGVTDYIVASATELPAEGMPYDRSLKYLMPENSDLVNAAEATFDYYNTQSGMYRTCTMSVIKTDAMDEVAEISRTIFESGEQLPADYASQDYQLATDHRKYGWSYYDFEHYMLAIAGDNQQLTGTFKTAISQAVVYKNQTPMLWGNISLVNHSGLSTLIMENIDKEIEDNTNKTLTDKLKQIKSSYRNLKWWDDVASKRFN